MRIVDRRTVQLHQSAPGQQIVRRIVETVAARVLAAQHDHLATVLAVVVFHHERGVLEPGRDAIEPLRGATGGRAEPEPDRVVLVLMLLLPVR